jgi:hypothetical protein
VRRPRIYASSMLMVLVAISATGQQFPTQSAMHARIKEIYDFAPSKVTDQVRQSKSKEMDAFWTEIKAHQETELPLLRHELVDTSNPPFFFADGSGLLLALSQSAEDEKLIAGALARVDMADFQSRQYLNEVHSLAVHGTDVTAAALHMLDDPGFQVFLPEHGAYRLDQAACLQVSLLPLKNEIWLPGVLQRIKSERNETAVKSLLLLLFYAQTDESDRVIAQFASDASVDSKIREFARSIVKHEKEIGIGKSPSPAQELKLREQRRKRMQAISDEAMDDMNELTEKIAQARTVSQ